MLSGFKGALVLESGRCLAAELVDRLRASGRFSEPILLGPQSVYTPRVDCEVVDVNGPLSATLESLARLLQTRFRGTQPVAMTACDILPSIFDLAHLMDQDYRPHAAAQFWWQIVAADPGAMGASAWKPRYQLRLKPGDLPQAVYPGHLVIARPGALRLDIISRLLVLAYRYRNRPLRQRFFPMLWRGLGVLALQDLRNLARAQFPKLMVSLPWHLMRAYSGAVRGTLALPEFEQHLARTVIHRDYLRDDRPFVISPTRLVAFAKDIDTYAELAELRAIHPDEPTDSERQSR